MSSPNTCYNTVTQNPVNSVLVEFCSTVFFFFDTYGNEPWIHPIDKGQHWFLQLSYPNLYCSSQICRI